VKLWIDAQISPAFASWLSVRFGVDAMALQETARGTPAIARSSTLRAKQAQSW